MVLFWTGLLAAFAAVSLVWAEALYAASLVGRLERAFLIVAALILFGGTLAGRVRRVIS